MFCCNAALLVIIVLFVRAFINICMFLLVLMLLLLWLLLLPLLILLCNLNDYIVYCERL